MTALSDVSGTDAPGPAPDSPDLFVTQLSGEVDMTRLDDLNEIAEAFLASAAPVAQVDLHEVTFMDSTGLGLLSRLRNIALTRGGHVILVEPTPSCLKMLRIVGFDTVFEIQRG
jgi:anti-sigma B factor antagonist